VALAMLHQAVFLCEQFVDTQLVWSFVLITGDGSGRYCTMCI